MSKKKLMWDNPYGRLVGHKVGTYNSVPDSIILRNMRDSLLRSSKYASNRTVWASYTMIVDTLFEKDQGIMYVQFVTSDYNGMFLEGFCSDPHKMHMLIVAKEKQKQVMLFGEIRALSGSPTFRLKIHEVEGKFFSDERSVLPLWYIDGFKEAFINNKLCLGVYKRGFADCDSKDLMNKIVNGIQNSGEDN